MRCLEEIDEVSHIYPFNKVWFWDGRLSPLNRSKAPAITLRLKGARPRMYSAFEGEETKQNTPSLITIGRIQITYSVSGAKNEERENCDSCRAWNWP